MHYAFLAIAAYLFCGLVVWWRHFGKFEDRDIEALVRVMAGGGDVRNTVVTETALMVMVVWPIALYEALTTKVFFNEALNRKRYTFGVAVLKQDISDEYRAVMLHDLQALRKRFHKRGIELEPLPRDRSNTREVV